MNEIDTTEMPKPAASKAVTEPADTNAAGKILQVGPRWAVIGIFLMLFLAGIALARVFLMPVVLGFLLALVFSPVRRFLERRGLPPGVSAIGIVCALLALLLTGAVALTEPLQAWIEDAPAIGREIEMKLRDLSDPAQAVLKAGEQVNKIASADEGDDVQEVRLREPSVFASMATEAPSMLAQIVFTLVLLLFLLSSGDMFYEKIVHVMPTFRDKRRAMRIVYDIERNLSHYLFTITLINAGLGVAIGTAMWLIGMPNPLLFGVIGFAFNFVPYLGALSGVLIAGLVGLLTFDEISSALIPAATYFILTSTEGQFVTPYFVGRRLEMNTVVIFLSVAFWAWMWSVTGMLLAVPLLVTIRVFCDHIPQLQPLGNFLAARGGEKDIEPEAATST